jgi:hypothetical protein
MSSYCANERIFAFQYGGNVLFPWYHLTQRSLLRIFNITNLKKNAVEFSPDEKARPDLNLQNIDLNFPQIVIFYKTYNLLNFPLDTFQINVWPIDNAKATHVIQEGCC